MRYAIPSLVLALLIPLGMFPPAMQQGMMPIIMSKQPGAAPLNPCLISAWPMNEGTGTTLHDTSTGGTNTATTSGTITWQSNAGFPGSSILWTTSSFATATSTTLTNFANNATFSISAWSTPVSGTQVYATNISSNSNHQGWLFIHHLVGAGNDVIEFQFTGTSGGNAIVVRGSTNFVGSRHYVVVTYDGSLTAAGVKLYLDGSLETPVVVTNALSTSTATGLAATFQNTRAADLSDSGQVMGYVEVYNCVLTSGQISTYNSNGPGIY